MSADNTLRGKPGKFAGAFASLSQPGRVTFRVAHFTFHASRAFILLTFLTLLASVMRLYHLGTESLWFDEADIVSRARQPVSILIQGFTQAGENGPLYTLLLHYWLGLLDSVPLFGDIVRAIFGGGYEAPIRALPAFFGAASVPPMYLLAKQVGGYRVGLIAATLLTINPFDIWYSQDAKMYSLLVLMTLITTLLYVRAINRNSLLLWGAYVLSTWVMLTTHSFGALVLLAQLVTTPFLFRTKMEKQQSRVRIVRWGWAMLLILGPLFPLVWLRVAALVTNTADVGGWYAPAGLHDIFGTLLVNFAVNRSITPWEAIGALTMGVLALLGIWTVFRSTSYMALGNETMIALDDSDVNVQTQGGNIRPLILALCLLPTIGLWLVTLRIPLFQARYLIMALPAYLIFVAVGLLWLVRQRAILIALPTALLVLTTSIALVSINYSPEPQKEDWRGAMVYLQDHTRLRDVVVVFPGYLRTAVDAYYKPGGQGSVPTVPIKTVPSLKTQGFGARELPEYLMKTVSCYERAWLVTSPTRQAQEDPKNSVQQWFQYNWHTFDTHEFNGVTVYGVAFNEVLNCWYPPPDFPEAHVFENGMQFSGYIYELRNDATTQQDASYFPLTLYWRTDKKLTMDYTINVSVKDASGKVVKSDALGPLNGFWPTTEWPANTDIIDYRDIRLPGGLTPGKYSVTLQIYAKDHPKTPLNLRDGETEVVFNEPLVVVPWKP